MIVYDLRCRKDHVFEAWFKDSQTYDEQVGGREIACPICGNTKIEKAVMAPRVNMAKDDTREKPSNVGETIGRYVAAMREVRRHIEENCDYVGDKFSEEARKIHYGETEARGIYGEATDAEATALDEEGVKIKKVPWVPREDA